MADAVNLALENSVEEAEQLLKCSTFSTREVQMIFQHRTRFEFMFRRRRVPASRFMSAIRFETDSHKLHTLRSRRGAGSNRSSRSDAFFLFRRSDRNERLPPRLFASRAGGSSALANAVGHAFVRKVHVLYQRVLRKYPGNVGLSARLRHVLLLARQPPAPLGAVTSQGLRLNLRVRASLWASPANWEYKHKGDISVGEAPATAGCGTARRARRAVARYTPASELKVAADVRARNEAWAARRRRGRQPGSPWRRPCFEAARARTRATACSTRSFVTYASPRRREGACEPKRVTRRSPEREFSVRTNRGPNTERKARSEGQPPVFADASRRRRRVVRRAGVRRRRGRDHAPPFVPSAAGPRARTRSRARRSTWTSGPATRKGTTGARADRLGAALRAAGASALASARTASPSALGFDGVHEMRRR